MDDLQWKFLHREILRGCVTVSFQHAKVYAANAKDEDKEKVRNELRRALKEIGEHYTNAEVLEEDHSKNIEEIARRIKSSCGPTLHEGQFRIGIAQKALNLYLKYLWCLDKIPRPPPHCPFDTTVINQLEPSKRHPWTKIESTKEYKDLVEAAKEKAGKLSLAEWELCVYEKGQGSE
jgi:hypothetical protein